MRRIAYITGFCALMLSASAFAGGSPQGMSDADMQRAMQDAAKLQQCFNDAGGEHILQQFANDAAALNEKIVTLCKAGKRTEAEQAAVGYSKKMAEDMNMNTVKKCGKMAEEMVKTLPVPQIQTSATDAQGNPKHLCDSILEGQE